MLFFCFFSYLLNVIKILKYYSKCIFLNYTTAAVAIQKTCTVGNANRQSVRTTCLWSILSKCLWGAALKLVFQRASNSAV